MSNNEQAVVAYRAAMTPQTFEQVVSFAQMVAKTSFCPQAFRNKPEECLAAITYGAELGLSPMQALRGVALINGQPACYGDTLLAVCQAHPQWGGKEERFEGTGEDRVAICVVRRKGEGDTEARFSVADAKAAQLWKKSGPWQQYPDRMLRMRARGFALRDAFADALRGIITAEEARDYPEHHGAENAREINPRPTAADRRAAMQAAELVEVYDADGLARLLQPGEVEPFLIEQKKHLASDDAAEAFAAANREHIDRSMTLALWDEERQAGGGEIPEPQKTNGGNGKSAKQRAQEIAAALRDAPDEEALKKLYSRLAADVTKLPEPAQLKIAEIYDEVRNSFPQPTLADQQQPGLPMGDGE